MQSHLIDATEAFDHCLLEQNLPPAVGYASQKDACWSLLVKTLRCLFIQPSSANGAL